jgi:hypothetical protein
MTSQCPLADERLAGNIGSCIASRAQKCGYVGIGHGTFIYRGTAVESLQTSSETADLSVSYSDTPLAVANLKQLWLVYAKFDPKYPRLQ